MTSQQIQEVGRKIGKAMARDAITEDMGMTWDGLDAQDGDVAVAAGIAPGTPEWDEMTEAARQAFEAERIRMD